MEDKIGGINVGMRVSKYLNRSYEKQISNKAYVWLFMRQKVNEIQGEGSTHSMDEEDLWAAYCDVSKHGEDYKHIVDLASLHSFIDVEFLIG